MKKIILQTFTSTLCNAKQTLSTTQKTFGKSANTKHNQAKQITSKRAINKKFNKETKKQISMQQR